jgi:hypothetical protein
MNGKKAMSGIGGLGSDSSLLEIERNVERMKGFTN